MHEENVKKRAWVKNAAIIFLAAMLLLTFFSNTIMNRSLPEVAARYTSSGTINARIRGMGTVAANDSYEVAINQTRTVREVNVRLDKEVEVGDILFTLADVSSEELKAAREELHNLLITYERAVINASLDGDYASEERGIRTARRNLDDARSELDDISHDNQAEIDKAQKALDSAQSDFDSADVEFVSAEATEAARKAVRDSAKVSLENAQDNEKIRTAAVTTARKNLDSLGGLDTPSSTLLDELNRSISETSTEITKKEAELRVAEQMHKANYDAFVEETKNHFLAIATSTSLAAPEGWNQEARRAAYLEAYAEEYEKKYGETAPLLVAYRTITGLNGEIKALNAELSRLRQQRSTEQGKDNSSEYNRLTRRLNDAEAALESAATARESAERVLATAQNGLDAATETRLAAETERNAAEQKRNAAESDLKLAQDSYKNAVKQANDTIRSHQIALEDLLFALSERQKNDGVTSALQDLDMSELQRQIEDKHSQIDGLEDEGAEGAITSPVNGVVKQINISAGNQTQPGMPMAVIEVLDRGYSLEFPITLEQSKKISVGDIAEIDTWWWGGDIFAVLASIRNDPQNPASSRILTFDISGDVTSGTQLNLSIGERSANYEVIVPNSAIRSDTNGDFVLVVLARNSPLGNRYTATRVDVNVLASDDTQSAVSGGLSAWGDYVITTSNKPIEPGMQVRLVDNP